MFFIKNIFYFKERGFNMKLILRAIKELEHRAKKIHNRFSFKKEETMKKQVAKRNALDFEGDVDSMLSASNELLFITTDGNQDRANEVLKSVQKLLIEGTKIILNQGTNEEMNELVMKETQNIIDLLIIIKDEEEQFKPFIKEKKHFFSEKWFLEIAKKIQISNDVSVFINELNGGDIALIGILIVVQSPVKRALKQLVEEYMKPVRTGQIFRSVLTITYRLKKNIIIIQIANCICSIKRK
jgi:hypothetical protein